MRIPAPDLYRVTDPRLRLVLFSKVCSKCRARCWLERMWKFEIGLSSHAGRYACTKHLCTSCAPTRRLARLYAARESAYRVDLSCPKDEVDLTKARATFPVPATGGPPAPKEGDPSVSS